MKRSWYASLQLTLWLIFAQVNTAPLLDKLIPVAIWAWAASAVVSMILEVWESRK